MPWTGVRSRSCAGGLRHQGFHVAGAAAAHDLPLRPITHGEQAVVGEEGHDEPDRKIEKGAGRTRPDRSAHRQQVVVTEAAAIAMGGQEAADRGAAGPDRLAGAVAVEAQDVAQHAQERRADQVPAIGEEAVQRRAVVFEAAAVAADAEAHLGVAAGDAEPIEEPGERRVGAIVEHDEAGVDRDGAVGRVHGDGADVAAGIGLGLEQRHVVAAAEHEGRYQTGDAATHHCDLHPGIVRASSRCCQ